MSALLDRDSTPLALTASALFEIVEKGRIDRKF